MPTLRPNPHTRAELYHAGDIDSDDTVLTPELVADEVGQTLPREILALLLGTPITECYHPRDSDRLKQGKFQSWDEYLAAGEASILKLPKRKEGNLVEAFVDGMYDEKLRRKCETMLDEVGWSWQNVKDFVMKNASAEMETEARQPTASLAHRHRKGEICPICSKKVNIPQPDDKRNDIGNSSPREPSQQPVQRPWSVVAGRKSQRIHRQTQAGHVRIEALPNRNLQRAERRNLSMSLRKWSKKPLCRF
jgi:hypothetical protein